MILIKGQNLGSRIDLHLVKIYGLTKLIILIPAGMDQALILKL